jgi:hypothetical protein
MKKVTFIYAYEKDEIWSTPMSLVNEFKERNWEVEIVSIGNNRLGTYHDNHLRQWVESKPKTDLVMFMDWGRFDSCHLDKELVPAIWVQESGDDPQNYSKNSLKATRFHLTLTPDYTSYQAYKQSGINTLWWTHFADTRIHYPIPNIDLEYVAVTTRGIGGSQFLDTLTAHSDGMIGNKNGMIGIDHSIFLQKGLMVVQNSRWGEITRRIFEAMACGKMVLTDRLHQSKQLDELFVDKKDIVYYDSLEDCINLINYYAENSEEREAIAQNGRNKVLENHTQKQRVDILLSALNL